jgi:hypothetical protein
MLVAVSILFNFIQQVLYTNMYEELTIQLEKSVYDSVLEKVGNGDINQFFNRLLRPTPTDEDLRLGYEAMAHDEAREQEALELAEATIGDCSEDKR